MTITVYESRVGGMLVEVNGDYCYFFAQEPLNTNTGSARIRAVELTALYNAIGDYLDMIEEESL